MLKSANKACTITTPSCIIALKQDYSLFARLLVVAKSRSDVNLQESLGKYEFARLPSSLFPSGGSLLCQDKSKLVASLENSVQGLSAVFAPLSNQLQNFEALNTLIIDGMALVHEISSLLLGTCGEFAAKYLHIFSKRAKC